jgi:hypothetical protein
MRKMGGAIVPNVHSRRDAFVRLVEIGLITERSRYTYAHAIMALCEALAVPRDALPDDIQKIAEMAMEFVEWQVFDELKKPSWWKDEWEYRP